MKTIKEKKILEIIRFLDYTYLTKDPLQEVTGRVMFGNCQNKEVDEGDLKINK